MAICNSCSKIRLGVHGNGNTLEVALVAVYKTSKLVPEAAYSMMEGIVHHAKKNGVCPSCMTDLQSIKRKMGGNL